VLQGLAVAALCGSSVLKFLAVWALLIWLAVAGLGHWRAPTAEATSQDTVVQFSGTVSYEPADPGSATPSPPVWNNQPHESIDDFLAATRRAGGQGPIPGYNPSAGGQGHFPGFIPPAGGTSRLEMERSALENKLASLNQQLDSAIAFRRLNRTGTSIRDPLDMEGRKIERLEKEIRDTTQQIRERERQIRERK
jgi:hypothetical protein